MEKNIELTSYVKEEDFNFGTVKIADDVVAHIAALAALEVEGVDSTAGNMGNDLLSKVGIKNVAQGVKVNVTGDEVKVNIALVIKYGYNIPNISTKVQDKIQQAIESMTELKVVDVDVRIAGVNIKSK